MDVLIDAYRKNGTYKDDYNCTMNMVFKKLQQSVVSPNLKILNIKDKSKNVFLISLFVNFTLNIKYHKTKVMPLLGNHPLWGSQTDEFIRAYALTKTHRDIQTKTNLWTTFEKFVNIGVFYFNDSHHVKFIMKSKKLDDTNKNWLLFFDTNIKNDRIENVNLLFNESKRKELGINERIKKLEIITYTLIQTNFKTAELSLILKRFKIPFTFDEKPKTSKTHRLIRTY